MHVKVVINKIALVLLTVITVMIVSSFFVTKAETAREPENDAVIYDLGDQKVSAGIEDEDTDQFFDDDRDSVIILENNWNDGDLAITPENSLERNNATVIYNLGTHEVSVGMEGENTNQFFDNDGNFAIILEENACFPYEVEFQYRGERTVKAFETSGSAVVIGDHVFTVVVPVGGNQGLEQIGVWIGDEYIAAKPEPKTFSNRSIMPMSLLPISEKTWTLDLNIKDSNGEYFTPSELKGMKLFTVLDRLSQQEINSGKNAVYMRCGIDDDYQILDEDTTLEVLWTEWLIQNSSSSYINDYISMELIAGSAAQLDPGNVRHIVNVYMPIFNPVEFNLYDINNGLKVEGLGNYITSHTVSNGYPVYYLNLPADMADSEFSLHISLLQDFGKTWSVINNNDSISVPINNSNTMVITVKANDTAKDFTAEIEKTNGIKESFRFHIIVQNRNSDTRYGKGLFLGTITDRFGNSAAKSINSTLVEYNDDFVFFEETVTLKRGYNAKDEFYVKLKLAGYSNEQLSKIENIKAFAEYCESLNDVKNPSKEIQDELFQIDWSKSQNLNSPGYQAVYNNGKGERFNGIFFTVFIYDKPYIVHVRVVESVSQPTYFRVTGAAGLNNIYIMPDTADSYNSGMNGSYQTILVDDMNVDLSAIAPIFETAGPNVSVYVGGSRQESGKPNGKVYVGGSKQESGKTKQDFSNGSVPVQYTVVTENDECQNYFIQFVKKNDAAKLFVNGPDNRLVLMENNTTGSRAGHENHHDIFISNIGGEPLTGLSVTLEDAENVMLDEYWTFDDQNFNTLAPFDLTSKPENIKYGELWNTAKIRLKPCENDGVPYGVNESVSGSVIGSLRITAGGQERVINLTGNVGNIEINTNGLPEAVKFVPYSSIVQTNSLNDMDKVIFEFSGDKVPGLRFNDRTGEIYGTPTQNGTFVVTVAVRLEDSNLVLDSKALLLTINDNDDDLVRDSTDKGYDFEHEKAFPNVVTGEHDVTFTVLGEYDELHAVWLDGERLRREGFDNDPHYMAEEGSTVITIKAKTFIPLKNGKHTIAVEFRNGEGTLFKVAKNFELKKPTVEDPKPEPKPTPKPPAPIRPDKSAPAKSATPAQAVTPVPTPAPPNPPPAVTLAPTQVPAGNPYPFFDISAEDWFFGDVVWVYDNKVMIGMGSSKFEPYVLVNPAMVSITLAKILEVDLDGSAGIEWFSAAFDWACTSGIGLFDNISDLTPHSAIDRGQLAVIIAKALRLNEAISPVESVVFPDMSEMTDEEFNAFQLLYHADIMTGKPNGVIDPRGKATRAELASILRRSVKYMN